MPVAAVTTDYQTLFPLCCGVFDIGEIEIEVQALGGDLASVKKTQIIVHPGIQNNSAELDKNRASKASKLPLDKYLPDAGSDSKSLDRCLADSFDSNDEIIEGSNEMKIMKRVVDKQRAISKNRVIRRNENRQQQSFFDQNSGLQRQDSISDTNSVNSNDVFVSIEDSKEIEYLDVLDKHLKTGVDVVDSTRIEDDFGDTHPKNQKFQANLDDIIEHLCISPCGECLPDVETLMDETNTRCGYPKSVLRKPRYSSPDQYNYSSFHFETKRGIQRQSILIRSSSNFNPINSSNRIEEEHTVRFQNVDIRNFKMTLGNHPSATTGPPVMLDGELIEPHHLARKIMTLDKYERTRPPRRKRRQLKLSLQQRHNILVKERGFSFEEVKGAWQESLQIRRQRKETLDRGLAMMKWDEVWESTCRKFSRLVDVTM